MVKDVNFRVKAAEGPQVLRRLGKKARIYPLHTMEVDQTIFVPDKEAVNFTTYVHKQARVLRRKFRTLGTVMCQDQRTMEWTPCEPSAPGARRGVAVTRLS